MDKYNDITSLSMKLEAIRQELANMGLWKTYHKLTETMQSLGWEEADRRTKMEKASRKARAG